MRLVGGDFGVVRATLDRGGITIFGRTHQSHFDLTALAAVQLIDRRTDVSYFGAIGGAEVGGIFGGAAGAIAGGISSGQHEVLTAAVALRGGKQILCELSHAEYVGVIAAARNYVESPVEERMVNEFLETIQPEAVAPAADVSGGDDLAFLEDLSTREVSRIENRRH